MRPFTRHALALPTLLSIAVTAGACANTSTTTAQSLPPLGTVENVDLERYLGTWYEIASYPTSFQKNCHATTATYSLRDDGQIDVLNTCRKGSVEGRLDRAQGRARVVDASTNAKLEVSFFRPFWGDYWIIDLDDEYRFAVVGHPGRDYLWILAREPSLDDDAKRGILERLEAVHYDPSRLQWTEHAE